MDYAIRGILQARIPEWVAIPFSRGSSNPGMEPRSPTLPADSLPDEPSENTEVGCHFLLQVTFLTQGSNSSLLCLLHWKTDSLPLNHLGIMSDNLPVVKKQTTNPGKLENSQQNVRICQSVSLSLPLPLPLLLSLSLSLSHTHTHTHTHTHLDTSKSNC